MGLQVDQTVHMRPDSLWQSSDSVGLTMCICWAQTEGTAKDGLA